jgi:hypothetical protein
VGIAYRAIQNGFDALFVTAAELIDDLSAAFRSGRLADTLNRYLHPAVLVVDEIGYLTYGTDAANMLFPVVNDRHRKKRAMVFTTNKPLSAWGSVLHDDDLAHAIIDRILERGRMLILDGPSMRTRHLGLDDPTAIATSIQAASVSGEGARISGIQRPEFPEPTTRTRCRSPEVSLTAFTAHLPNLQSLTLMDTGLRRYGPARPTRDASYSVSVRQVVALLPRFFQTAPRGHRPCASLALRLHQTLGRGLSPPSMSNMLGTLVPVETTNRFPQGLGNLAQTARFPHSHKPITDV